MVGLLPPGFGELEPFCANWALSTTSERHQRRTSSTLPELTVFYDAMSPRIVEALSHLDACDLPTLGATERRLLDLCLSLADVALAVEKYQAPAVVEAKYSNGFVIDTTALG